MTTDTRVVPIFPLGVMLLPGEELDLHIFEPRYQQLISECEADNMHFGIAYFEQGKLKDFGCLVKLKRIIKKYPNGFSDIVVEGISIFKMRTFMQLFPGKLYSGGEVEILPERHFTVSTYLQKIFNKFLLIKNEKPVRLKSQFSLARVLQLNYHQKYKMVAADSAESREEQLVNDIKLKSIIQLQEKNMSRDFHLN